MTKQSSVVSHQSSENNFTQSESRKLKTDSSITMEELLASRPAARRDKLLNLYRGLEVEGEIVAKADKELVLDLGTKSEGIISTRDISKTQLDNLKVGDKLKAYVLLPENESGQVVLTLHSSQTIQTRGSLRRGVNWAKFFTAQNQKSKLNGKVVEVNKGGLIVEIDKVRGFLPNSQVGFELLAKSTTGMEGLIGQDMTISVIEVDENDNRLIFTQRGQISPEVLSTLKSFKNGQKVLGKIVAILPFGLVVDLPAGRQGLGGVEGLVFISDVSWDKVEDLNSLYKAGQEIKALVLGVDEELGRINLSIKHLSEDPFGKLAEIYPADEVVKGEITDISDAGVSVKLEDAEGFLPSSKIKPGTNYEVGASQKFLVDGVDMQRRRVNLAPFVTSTEGLIYK